MCFLFYFFLVKLLPLLEFNLPCIPSKNTTYGRLHLLHPLPLRKWLIATRPKVEPMSVSVPVTCVRRAIGVRRDVSVSLWRQCPWSTCDVRRADLKLCSGRTAICHWILGEKTILWPTNQGKMSHVSFSLQNTAPNGTILEFIVPWGAKLLIAIWSLKKAPKLDTIPKTKWVKKLFNLQW